jgi:hypothetical protein
MTRQKITPMSGQALYLTLESANGKEVPSKINGTEYRYDVTQNGQPAYIYLTAQGRDAIARTRVADGEEIRLLKMGRNGDTRYEVVPVSDATLPPPVEPNDRRFEQHSRQAVRQPPPPRQLPAPPAATATPETSHPIEDLLVRCFECAGRALLRAHDAIGKTGLSLEPPIWEDVRAVGISLFIERNKRENGR